ncbi:MAG TPA: sarcosine oxidase subunit gamma family protein [Woeseiaceae bacterium]
MTEVSPRRHALEDFLQRRGVETAGNPAVRVVLQANCEYLNLRGRAADPAFRHAVESVLRQNLPTTPNTCTQGLHTVYWLGPDEWLLVSAAGSGVEDGLGIIPQTCFSSVNGQSGGFMQMRLTGSAANKVLAKGCTLDLHPAAFRIGQCAQTLLAKAGVLLAATDDRPSFSLIVRRSFAEYVALWLAHSGDEFGVNFTAGV